MRALDLGYDFNTFTESAIPGRKALYMRHDIDVDPFAALEMATVEHELGVRSTFFFLPTAPYYNIQAGPVKDVLQSIERLGSSVQLHFDAAPFQSLSLSELEGEIATQGEWLSVAAGKACIEAVSFHRPAPQVVGVKLSRFISAYDPRFMHDMKYVSDSAGQWREGCVCRLLGAHPVIQCLIHPIWWGETGRSVASALGAFMEESVQRYDGWLRKEIRTYGANHGAN